MKITSLYTIVDLPLKLVLGLQGLVVERGVGGGGDIFL
jgi:hypothetical protein